MNNSFYNYVIVYNYLKEFLEGFNEHYYYKMHLETFLEGSVDSIGMFSQNGLFIFFKLKEELQKQMIIKETSFYHLLNILINPNNLPSFKNLEVLLLKYLINFDSTKEFVRKHVKYRSIS